MMEKQIRRHAAAFGWIDRVCAVRDAQGRLIIELYGDGTPDILRQGEGFSRRTERPADVALTEPREMENEFGTCLEMHERAPFRAVVGIGRQQRSGVFGFGRHRLLVPDRRRCCLPAARRRHGLGRGRRAGQPHARQPRWSAFSARASRSRTRSARFPPPCGCARTARASSPRRAHARPVHRAGGEPEMRRGALMCARTGVGACSPGNRFPSAFPTRKTRASRCRCGFPTAICSSWCQTACPTGWMMRGARALREHGGEGPKELGAACHRGPAAAATTTAPPSSCA